MQIKSKSSFEKIVNDQVAMEFGQHLAFVSSTCSP